MLTPFTRVFVVVLDGVGVGALPDASAYGDAGSDTLGNIARRQPLRVPTLRALGLGHVANLGVVSDTCPRGAFGRMAEASAGKDSVTGHWEMAGILLERPFPVFPNGFPAATIEEFSRRTGRRVIGNRAASGTAVIDELGPEQLRTGALIVYTSADSVVQVAAHESVVPLAELYRACEIAYKLYVEGLGIARVIARPYIGTRGAFTRTSGRRDYAQPPPDETLLDMLHARGVPVVAIGKIDDLFVGRGITRAFHTTSDEDGVNELERQLGAADSGFVFVNLVDFDSRYGHRNDVEGFAVNLERFDQRLGQLLPKLGERDLLMVTADHGNDPTTSSTDHSREYVPLLVTGQLVRAGTALGTRTTFADLGQTVAEASGVGPLRHGTSFLGDLIR